MFPASTDCFMVRGFGTTRDGTTQVAFDRGGHPPVDFIARLAALVPKPRVNLTRYHGVLACAARL
jgi:hypothetical protein